MPPTSLRGTSKWRIPGATRCTPAGWSWTNIKVLRQAGGQPCLVRRGHRTAQEMDAMDEFQEADILWPDTEDELVPFAPMDTEELYAGAGSVSSVAPVFGRRFVEGFFLSGAGPGASPDADDEEWQEADVLWPDTADGPRGTGGLMWPFSGSSGGARAGRRVKPAAARRDGWTTGPAASSPINIPANVALRRS